MKELAPPDQGQEPPLRPIIKQPAKRSPRPMPEPPKSSSRSASCGATYAARRKAGRAPGPNGGSCGSTSTVEPGCRSRPACRPMRGSGSPRPSSGWPKPTLSASDWRVDIARDERELAALRLNPQSVSLRAEIKTALELRQSTVDARARLARAASINTPRPAEQIDRELAELRPGWRHDDLRAFSVDVATRAEIDRLADEDRAIADAQTELRRQARAARSRSRRRPGRPGRARRTSRRRAPRRGPGRRIGLFDRPEATATLQRTNWRKSSSSLSRRCAN